MASEADSLGFYNFYFFLVFIIIYSVLLFCFSGNDGKFYTKKERKKNAVKTTGKQPDDREDKNVVREAGWMSMSSRKRIDGH